ncbi:radical SAM protein [Paramaledivibacter caminithermalis]|jgi:MoaA/NifB/PqqE/SkfB family radical SAM enzyme|uniref:4Fe-4S single cluster domain-containing protein n=1 Tax=Paramaledivibacter caminithermalis (strain DSM 15212 / CIP 107654 / DViRD3) TaxID=1121301 RepID=A0A1M6RBR9_PARC5|nr:radical SAM protein [Paramaledivibacter caminithermalis]SHK29901.1 4Fe-4S single cluster domain-containing protein [Paramaledivibacter caminithermalis DSM 15212]
MLPISAIVYLTHKCSLECKHCFLTDSGKLNKNELSYKSMITVLDDFMNNKVCMVAYTGGDPLLHTRLFDILNETKKRGMLPLLGLSGIGVTKEIAEKIYNSGVRCVQVSLDGSNEKINSLFRGKNVFDDIINSIKLVNKAPFNNIAWLLPINNILLKI